MFASKIAKKYRCSTSLVLDLIRQGKLTAEERPTRSGRKAKWVTTKEEDVAKLLSGRKTGWHKTTSKSRKIPKSVLSEFVVYRKIPTAKRALLTTLSEHPLDVLKMLVELTK